MEIKDLLDLGNNIILRKALIEDCMKLSHLKKEIWETTYRGIYPNEKFDNYDFEKNALLFKNIILNNKANLYVITDKNDLIGYIEFGSPLRPFGNYTQEIGLFYIKKSYQNQGLGRKLFAFAYTAIKNTGAKDFFISCNKYNYPAQKFYEKMGGKIVYIDEDSLDKSLSQIKYEYKIKETQD